LPRQQGQESLIDIVNGPFDTDPPRPDIEEKDLRRGNLIFDRYTYLSYFPFANPNPQSEDFRRLRQRIRVRVVVTWKEKVGHGKYRTLSYDLSTVVHNEKYNPKPALTRLREGL